MKYVYRGGVESKAEFWRYSLKTEGLARRWVDYNEYKSAQFNICKLYDRGRLRIGAHIYI